MSNLALGKYARVGSGRDHAARAGGPAGLNNVAECFIAGCGEVLFVNLLVVLPGVGVPDFEEIHGPDHHALFGEVRVPAVVGRQRDAPL